MALTDVKSEQIQSSVALAGSPTTTTQSASDNSTKIATTAYVETAVANLVASAPASLNTLDELAAALNDDASFSTTVTNSIAAKLPLAGGALTGNLSTNSRVAIGQSSFTGGGVLLDLHASGSSVGAQAAFYNDHNTSGFFVGIAGNSTGNPLLYNAPNTNIEFYTNSAIAMTISSGGTTFAGDVVVTKSSAKVEVTESSGASVRMIAGGSTGYIGNYSNHTLQILTNSSPRVYINNTGNVGIGAAPSTSNNMGDVKLQFPSNYALGGSYSVFGETLSAQSTIVGNNVRPLIGTNNQVMRHRTTDAGNFMKLTYNRGITFHTGLATTVGTGVSEDTNERMRIDNDGYVAIGTTTPQPYTYGDLVIDGVTGSGNASGITLVSSTTSYGGIFFADGTSGDQRYRGFVQYNHDYSSIVDTLLFGTGGGTRMYLDGGGKLGLGITPSYPIDLRAQYQPSGGIALNLFTDGGAWIQQKSSLSGVGSYQIGPAADDWSVYDNTSSEYQLRVRDNANHKGSLQHKCHANFHVYPNSSDSGEDEKSALAGAVYRLHNARINPGRYSNGYWYVGVGRHYNTTTAFVEFKVNYVKASTAKCSFTVSNSADSQTRRAQLYWSLDGRNYTSVASTSFGSGQATASYELTTNMIANTDSIFNGSIYWRCYLIDSASVHETLVGWREFVFEAFAESMTFDGGFEKGVANNRQSLVTRSYGATAGTQSNYVPTSRPYGHTFTGTTNVAVSSNAAYQQFGNKNYGYLNEDLMKIVTTPVHGIQILAEGQIMYSFNQDMITAGSTGYAYAQVRRHNYNNSANTILGYHLITNTNGQWDMMTGQGIFDVSAGDIISFYFGATNITNMDGGSWSYYNILWWPLTVTGTGSVATGLPWSGETTS